MISISTESAWRGVADCRHCTIRHMVLFGDLQEPDFNLIHAPIDHMAFVAGEPLYAEGSRSQGLFTLRTGMIKLVRVTSDGRQRIVRVLRPGDVVGLEALATAHYDSEAVALTDVAVCRIPLDVIHALESNGEHIHRRLTLKWQQTLREADNWLADLNFGTARHRLANFILMMRNPNGNQMSTLFSREDMGAMMDLKPETISREVTKLVRENVIEPMDKIGRSYKILQPDRLQHE